MVVYKLTCNKHETIQKKHFTVYPRLQIHLSILQNLLQNSIHYSSWLSNIKEKVMKDSFAEKDFLTSWESRQRIFLPFCKKHFYHRKEVLKVANSTSKGFASNPLQMALLTKEKAKKQILHWNSLQRRI